MNDSAHATAAQIGTESTRLYGLAMAEGCSAAKAVAARVGEQPLMYLAIALGLGFAGGRLLAR